MKKYNLKDEFKNLIYFTKIIFIILVFFTLFCLLFVVPIYYLSKHFLNVYSFVILSLFFLFLIFLLIKKGIKIYDLYKKPLLFCVHLLVYWVLPIFLTVFILILETVIIRLFYQLLSFFMATTVVVSTNLLLIFLLILLKRQIYKVKIYLSNNKIKK